MKGELKDEGERNAFFPSFFFPFPSRSFFVSSRFLLPLLVIRFCLALTSWLSAFSSSCPFVSCRHHLRCALLPRLLREPSHSVGTLSGEYRSTSVPLILSHRIRKHPVTYCVPFRRPPVQARPLSAYLSIAHNQIVVPIPNASSAIPRLSDSPCRAEYDGHRRGRPEMFRRRCSRSPPAGRRHPPALAARERFRRSRAWKVPFHHSSELLVRRRLRGAPARDAGWLRRVDHGTPSGYRSPASDDHPALAASLVDRLFASPHKCIGARMCRSTGAPNDTW